MKVVGKIDPTRLVFLDEAGANAAMGRSHAWIRRGTELIDPRPAAWGLNLTMIGALRSTGWITMKTQFKTANGDRFMQWLRTSLLPKLRRGDFVVLDNHKTHHDARVRPACEGRGVRVLYLPPYSPDLNPIEPGWAIVKKAIRQAAPRESRALRRVAQAGRRRVRPLHCERWFQHSGYLPRRRAAGSETKAKPHPPAPSPLAGSPGERGSP